MVGPNATMETAASTPSLVLLERLMDSPGETTYPKFIPVTNKGNSLPAGSTLDKGQVKWPRNFLQEWIRPRIRRKSDAADSRRVDRVDVHEGEMCKSSPVISVQSQAGNGYCENCGKVMRDVATNTDLEESVMCPGHTNGVEVLTSKGGIRQQENSTDQIRTMVVKRSGKDVNGGARSEFSEKAYRRRSLPTSLDWWSEKVLRRQSTNLKENVRRSWCPEESDQSSARGLSVSDQSINCRMESQYQRRINRGSDGDLQSPRYGVWKKKSDGRQKERVRISKHSESAPNLSYPSTPVDKSETARLAAWWEESPFPVRSRRFTFQSHSSGKKVVLKKGQKGLEVFAKGNRSHSLNLADLEELMAAVSGSEGEEETETEDETSRSVAMLVPYRALEEEILLNNSKYTGNINQSNSSRSMSSLSDEYNYGERKSLPKSATAIFDRSSERRMKHSLSTGAKLSQSSPNMNRPVPSTRGSAFQSPSLDSVIHSQFLKNASLTSLACQRHHAQHQPSNGFRTPKRLQEAVGSVRGRGRGRGQLRHSWAGNPNPISGSVLKLAKGDRLSWMGVVSEMPVIPEDRGKAEDRGKEQDRGKERERDADNRFNSRELDAIFRTGHKKQSKATSALGSQDPRLDPESSIEDDLQHVGTSELDDPDLSQSETLVRKGSGSRTKKSLKRKVTPPTSYFNPWVLQPQQLRQKLENLQQEQVVRVDQVQKADGGEYDALHRHSKGEIIVVDVFDDSKEVSSGDVVKTTRKMPQECVTEDMANGSVSVNNSNMDASYVGERSLGDDVVCDVTNMNQTKDTMDARHEITDNYARTTNNNRSALCPQAKDFVSKGNRTGAIGKRRSQSLMPEDQLNAYRQRKKSLALAMNEGRLEMKEVAMRPLDVETDMHLIAQLNQLNRELMDLSRSGSSTSPSSPGPNTNQTAFSVAEQSLEIERTDEDKRTGSRPSSPFSPVSTMVPETKRSSYDARSPISPRRLKGSLQMDIPGKAWKQSNNETPKGRKTGEVVTINSANSSKKSSPEQKGNSENSKNTKESKSTSPRDVLSRIKVRLSNNKFSRNSPQRSSAGKVEIQILRPNVESIETRMSNVSLRRAASLKYDPDSRKTWPNVEASTEETCEPANLTHVATDPGQVSKYQRNNSVGPVERQRKRPVLPDENVSYLQALEESQRAPGSSTDSGLGKDHRHSKSSADSLLEDMPLDLSSPVSSQGNSNPPSRPLSSDCGDLPWERGLETTGSRRSREYQRFLSKSMPQSPCPLTPSLGSHEDLLDRPFSTPGSHEDLLSVRGEGTRASGSSQGSSIGQAAVQMRAKPPKPRHRPARRSKTDLGDPKIIKAALTLAKLQGEESTKVERRRSTSGRKRPTSALGIVGMLNSASNDGESPARQPSHPERKLSPPSLRLSLTPTQESVALDVVGDDYPAEMPLTPKRRSQSLGSTGIDLSQLGLLKRSLSLPCGLGSEDEMVSDPDLTKIKARMSENFEQCFAPTLAEALFDHVTMDAGELTFQAGDMIEITDMADGYWWWGCIDKQEGWLPAPFVRLRVSQGETVEECISRLSQENSSAAALGGGKPSHEPLIRKVSLSFLSNDQVRANVIREIITTERDYVKNLADICVGYIEQAHSRPDMFSPPLLQKLFCNIEDIFTFQQQFLADLETCIDDRMPHLSSIGACFLKRKAEFEIYGEYCNNYPHAINELKDLMKDNKYVQFFEACRLLQSMIKISLDGFLLTPVQKICKYPLQLNELLKYTRPQHPDFRPLEGALDAMRDVAQSINERKRRIEHIENIAVWQKTIGDWEGDDVLERSAMLIYSDEVNRVSLTGRHRTSPRQLFLFDHQLIICRKDILRRDLYLYKDRIDLDDCQIEDLPDGKENEWNVTLRYAWKIQNVDDQPKVYVFMCRSRKEKRRWLRHFAKERKIVHDGLTRGSSFMAAKEAALRTTSSANKPSKPSDRATVRRALSMPQRKIREQLRDANLQLPRQSSPEVYADLTPKRKGRSLFGFQVGKK